MERIFVFLKSPSAGSAILLGATLIGVLLANTALAAQYFSLIHIQLGPLSAIEWVNDALMAIFFLFVGLEVKRELVSGELNTNAKRIMPGIAALMGVIVPAVIMQSLLVGLRNMQKGGLFQQLQILPLPLVLLHHWGLKYQLL